MPPKTPKEQSFGVDTTRAEFITKLSTAAEAMRQFGNFADALAKVVSKAPLEDPEVVEALQLAIDAIPATPRKRKLTALGGDEGGKRRKREKKVKDPNAPKAPPSAYILFQNDIRNAVRQDHPDIQYRELMGVISQQWNALPPEKKQPYFDRVTAAKQTHEEELAKYNAANPNHVQPISEGPSKMARKEAEVSEKPEKKVTSKSTKLTPKSAEIVASSEEGVSDDESTGEDKEEGDRSSEADEEEEEEPAPPPAKKAKKAEKRK